jgi:tetratricopeptide (TPR) repeat protein
MKQYIGTSAWSPCLQQARRLFILPLLSTPQYSDMSSTARFFGPGLLKTQVVLSLLVGALWSPLVHADDYAEVNRLVKAGQTTEALTKADQYLSAKPRDPQMRFLKGVILAETGKTNDAVATFVKLTEDYPELPEPYNNLAVLYAGQSQYDKARLALEMAIRTNPSYSTAHENLGDVYAKLASQSYSKALQLDSSNTGVPTKLALIRNLFAPDGRTSKTIPSAPVAAPAIATTVTAKTTPAPAASSPEKVSAADAAPDVTAAIQTWAKAWAAKDMSG